MTIRAFISYTHDSTEHMDRVWGLCEGLRKDGIECGIDQHEISPPEGWPRWCRNQIQDSQFVLVVCTETYKRRYEGKEDAGKGLGAKWEGFVISQELYDTEGRNTKFIPIVFSPQDAQQIPLELHGATRYDLSTQGNYDNLFRHLTSQPARVKSGVATQIRPMPPLDRKQEFRGPVAKGRSSLSSAMPSDLGQAVMRSLLSMVSTSDITSALPDFLKAMPEKLPRMQDLFEVISDPGKVPAAIFRTGAGRGSTPYEVPYVAGRAGAKNIRDTIYKALLGSGGMLLVQSRAGVGKTREVAELAVNLCSRGWKICVAKSEGDTLLNRLDSFPAELADDRLLLIFDDLHRRTSAGTDNQAPYAERLEALLVYLDKQMTPDSLRVLATARSEPHHQQQLGFEGSRAPWSRFKVYDLPEFTQEGLQQILTTVAERAHVKVDASDAVKMVTNSDKTIRTLVINVDLARDEGSLTLSGWQPSQGESWQARFLVAQGRYGVAEEVYQALHLMREAGMPTCTVYVTALSSALAQTDTRAAVEGLVDMGLMGLRAGVLDAFSDEQLADSLREGGGNLLGGPPQWDAVVDAVIEVAEPPASWAEDLATLSARLIGAQRDELAISVTNVAIERGQNVAVFYKLRGAVRWLQRRYAEAEADFTAGIGCGGDDVDVYFWRGWARGAHGRPAEAEADFTAAIERGKDDADVYSHRGVAREMQGRFAEAEADFTAAIERGKDDADVYFLRGVARGRQGRFAEAEADFTAAIARKKDDAAVYFSRGLAREGLGRDGDAEADYTAAIARKEDDADVYHWRGRARADQGRDAEAEADFTAAIERGKDDAEVYLWRGRTRADQGRPAEAEADYTAAIERNPNAPEPFSQLGLVRRLLGHREEANDAYRRAVNLDSSRYLDWLGLADSARHAGNEAAWKEALERARPLLDQADSYSAACFASIAGEVDRAIDLLRQALEKNPELTRWAKEDPDLQWIRDDPRFSEITGVAGGQSP